MTRSLRREGVFTEGTAPAALGTLGHRHLPAPLPGRSEGRLPAVSAGRRLRGLLASLRLGRTVAGLLVLGLLGPGTLCLEQAQLHPQLDDGLALLMDGLVQVVVLYLESVRERRSEGGQQGSRTPPHASPGPDSRA